MKIYLTGYQAVSLTLLERAAKLYDAVIVDIRLSPRSMNPMYNLSRLQARFGDRYIWAPNFGNVNYKNDGPIEIKNFTEGFHQLKALREGGCKCVILMCSCWDHRKCHRTTVAKLLKMNAGVECEELDAATIKETIQPGLEL